MAHEIGHYAFFLIDNYLGLEDSENDEGQLRVDIDCQGSVMTDAYREDYSEYLDREGRTARRWEGACLDTVAEKKLGRSDWETIDKFYSIDYRDGTGTGPSTLPLNLTKVSIISPDVPDNTLVASIISLTDAATNETLPLRWGEAQAYLIKTQGTNDNIADDSIIPVGTPNGALIQAHGAAPGDRFCVFSSDRQLPRFGCLDNISSITSTLSLKTGRGWQPQIEVTPVNSATLAITVTQSITAGASGLRVQIFPGYNPVTTGIVAAPFNDMIRVGPDTFFQTLTFSQTVLDGHVHIWETGVSPAREVIVPFFISPGWNGNQFLAWGANILRTFSTNVNSWSAPMSSPDGQVMIFNVENPLENNVASLLQPLTVPPPIPSWLTPVGQVYRYKTAQPAPTNGLTIHFQYLQRELPDIREDQLRIYYSPDGGASWQRQEQTNINESRNFASARVQGEGLYALMATIATPGLQPGWNLFAYPDTDVRPVNLALASIEFGYTSVYHQDRSQSSQWRLYDRIVQIEHPEFTGLVNDLTEMVPLESYWVYAVTNTVPYIGVPGTELGPMAVEATQLPPATFYGWIGESGSFTPKAGDPVVAIIDNRVCGEGVVTDLAGLAPPLTGSPAPSATDSPYKIYLPYISTSQTGLAYKIQVRADTGDGCGVFGREIIFKVGNQVMPNNHPWGNSQACFHPLGVPSGEPSACFTFAAPDLVITDFKATENDVQVVLENQGTAAVPAGRGFWVDVYINPARPPQRVNDIWQNLADEGLAWGVRDLALPLMPGDAITLTLASAFYRPDESNFSGSLASGTPLYAHVDSAHANTDFGSVLEIHEMLGAPYSNIIGPVLSTLGSTLGMDTVQAQEGTETEFTMPPRPQYLNE